MCIDLVLRYHGCGSILSDHIAVIQSAVLYKESGKSFGHSGVNHSVLTSFRYVSKFCKSDSQEVECQSHRLSVEVSAGDYIILIREDDGVICNSVDFLCNYAFYVLDSVTGCAVDLRKASL